MPWQLRAGTPDASRREPARPPERYPAESPLRPPPSPREHCPAESPLRLPHQHGSAASTIRPIVRWFATCGQGVQKLDNSPCLLPAGNRRAEQVVGIHDAVGISLLREEPLSVGRIVRVEGVAGNHRIEMGLASVDFRP